MTIRPALMEDAQIVTALALRLWPDHEPAELQAEIEAELQVDGETLFVAEDADTAVGFAQCSLRQDYVEGTHTRPVGYLEGIYVLEGYRRAHIARALVGACERWAQARGAQEFASDCLLDNELSIAFHLGLGFREANRIVCFVKEL